MNILLVEDEPRLLRALAKGLKQEDYSVETCDNGTTALALATNNDYDLMIFDRMLPGMDGLAVTRAVRAKNIAAPILMLSAKGQTRDKIDGLDAGADDYMTKPFSFEELLARLRALLRRPAENAGTELTLGDLTLDLQAAHCERRGRTISLTATEMRLLEYLLRNSDRVITKEQIVDHVWDYDSYVQPNTVEAYMSYLRKKIDGGFRVKLIHTLRGLGYKMSVEKR